MTVKNYVLDINKTSLQHPSIVLRQDDYNIYTVNISVTENGAPVNLGSYTLNFLGITPAGAKIIDGDNFITTPADLAAGKFSYKFPKEAAGSKGVYDVAYFRLKTTSGTTSTIDLNLRVLGGIDLTADEVKDYITVDDTLRNTLVSEVFKRVDAKVDKHLATVKKGDKGDKGDPGKDAEMPVIGGRNLLLDTGRSFTGIGTNITNGSFNTQGGRYYLAGGKKVSDLYNQYGSSGYLTLSFDWVASGPTISGEFSPVWDNIPWGGLSTNGNIKPNVSNNSGHYKNTVGLNAAGYSSGIANSVMFRQDNLQGNVTISNLKLEAGNVATDWTPAPEDIDSAIAKAPKLNGNNMYVGDNTYMGTNTFMDGVSLGGKNVVNGLTDTDWLDIPLAEGRTGTAKYKVSLGKVFVHIDMVKGMTAEGNNAQGQIGTLPVNPSPYYTRHIGQVGHTIRLITIHPNGVIYVSSDMGNTMSENDSYVLDIVLM